MNRLVAISVLVPVALFLFCVGTSLMLALRSDARLSRAAPGTLSYKWGFFLGFSGIITAIIAVAAGVVAIRAGAYRDWFPLGFCYAVATGIASYGVLARRKWGWVLHIPLSLNMGLWAFNSVYVHNRWREMPWR